MTEPEPQSYPFLVRVRRALARRFPRTRRGWNRIVAKLRHHLARRPAIRLRRSGATFRWLVERVRDVIRRRRETRLTVAVEISAFWEPLTGIGWYLYRLLEHLADHEEVRLRLYGPTVVDSPDLEGPVVEIPEGPALETVVWKAPEGSLLPAGWIIRWLRWMEPLLIAADRNRVVFAPNYFLPRRFLFAGGARVATVHDLGFRRFAWTLRRETLADLEEKFEHAVREAGRVISVSGAVKRELVDYGYADPARVRVIHHGPGQLSTVTPGQLPPGVTPPFGLFIGTIEPRKNVSTLLAAWRRLARDGARPPLVLCGRFGWKSDDLRAAVHQAESAGWARHLGYVDDAELAALLRAAEVVVFPSLYEGFGLPAVEAQWAGTPLVASDIPVLREVTDGAALLVPPLDDEALTAAIRRVLDRPELREDLRRRGLQRVRRLSWRRAAAETAAVWFEAAGETVKKSPAGASTPDDD